MDAALTATNKLGRYLRDRRARLDPAALGFSPGRRRTPGLRREEVAQRANISTTWYTWLEQGRGGAPSPDVLDRIARGLMLTEPEREHLFILALGHPPEVRYKPVEAVTARLQRVLDALNPSPAIVKTATWNVVAWNKAATVVLTDYAQLRREDRNILRLMFSRERDMSRHGDWESLAGFVVAAFRADVSRAGADEEVGRLVEDLCRNSDLFAELWRRNDVLSQGEGSKRMLHPKLGPLNLDYSSFSVDGRPELSMMVYSPATQADEDRIRAGMVAYSSEQMSLRS